MKLLNENHDSELRASARLIKSSIGCWFPETPSIKSIWSFLKYQHIESKTWTWWNMSNWNMYLIWNAPKNASKKTRMTSHKEGENYRISWIGGNTVPTIRFLLIKEAFLRVNVWKKEDREKGNFLLSLIWFSQYSHVSFLSLRIDLEQATLTASKHNF